MNIDDKQCRDMQLECSKCIHREVCKTADTVGGYIHNCRHFIPSWMPASDPPRNLYEQWIAYESGGDHMYSTGYFDMKCWRSAITGMPMPATYWMPIYRLPNCNNEIKVSTPVSQKVVTNNA